MLNMLQGAVVVDMGSFCNEAEAAWERKMHAEARRQVSPQLLRAGGRFLCTCDLRRQTGKHGLH